MEKTIKISDDVKRNLDKMKMYERETYSDVIGFLLEDNLELSEKTKKELDERKKNPELISHEDVGRVLGL